MSKPLRIGEVARLLGVTTKTIRHYHTIGLLAESARTASGYRLYTADDLLRLHTIRRLQQLGLSLQQIGALLGTAGDAPTLRAVLQALLTDVTAQIAALEECRSAIERLLDSDPAIPLNRPVAQPATVAQTDALLAHLPAISPALRQQEEDLWALIDAFAWPTEQVAMLRDAAERYIAEPKALQALHELSERTLALAQLAPEAPEIAQAAAAWRDYQRLYPPPAAFAPDGPLARGLIGRVLGDLLRAELTPAQQRLMALLHEPDDDSAGDS